METAYDAHLWHDVFIMIGGAAAALTGLLFVAASLHADFLMRAPHWRMRVFNNTMGITAMIIEAAILLIPQSTSVLGYELIAFNLSVLVFLPIRFFVHLVRNETEIRLRRPLITMGALAMGVVGGVSLVTHTGGGIYWVLASMLIVIWIVILNAMSLMTVSGQASAAPTITS